MIGRQVYNVSKSLASKGHYTNVTLIPGHGIGPEISESVVKICDAAKFPVNFIVSPIDIPKNDPTKPVDISTTVESIMETKIALKGPLETPVGAGRKSFNLLLRKTFNLYANVRPCVSLAQVPTKYPNVNMVIIRENTEGEYSGLEHQVSPRFAESIKLITENASTNVAEYAFNYAKQNARKKITLAHKANIMQKTDGYFLECAQKVASNHPDITFEEMHLDQVCFKLIRQPEYFDVLLLPNLYGDIISDLGSGLVGGLGVTGSANIGAGGFAIFEAVHGTAPDIAGRDLANPTALLFSTIMMLKHIGLEAESKMLKRAILRTLDARVRTRDLGGMSSCSQYTEEIINNLY